MKDVSGEVISVDDLILGDRIGDGGFCTIYRAKYRRDERTTVAVKMLKEQHSNSKKLLQKFAKEIVLHSQIRHPHVLLVFGGCTIPTKLCLVTELMELSVRDAMDTQPAAFTPQTEIDIARTVALGLNHLHSLKILHRDVKSANTLLDQHWSPKIADFGLARIKEADTASMTLGIGTPAYMAPEMFMSSKYTLAVDWFAFGILLWELVTKDHPCKDVKYMEIYNVDTGDRVLPAIPASCPDNLAALMRSLWHKDPALRADFDVVMVALDETNVVLEGAKLTLMAQDTVTRMASGPRSGSADFATDFNGGGIHQFCDLGIGDRPGQAFGAVHELSAAGAAAARAGMEHASAQAKTAMMDHLDIDDWDDTFMNNTMTWEDILQFESKAELEGARKEITRLKQTLAVRQREQSVQLAQAHSRTLQTKERILAEHREELAGLQKALLKERIRQKKKLRDRLKKLGREIKPDLDFTLKLLGKLDRMDPDAAAAAIMSPRMVCKSEGKEGKDDGGGGTKQKPKPQPPKLPKGRKK